MKEEKAEEIDVEKAGYILLGLAILFLALRYFMSWGTTSYMLGIISEEHTLSELSPFSFIVSIIFSVILIFGIIGLITLSINKVVLNLALWGSIVFFAVEYIIILTMTDVDGYWWNVFYGITGGGMVGITFQSIKAYNAIDK